MISPITLAQASLFSAFIGTSLCAPLVERQTTPTCDVFSIGNLIVRPTSNTATGPVTYAGIVSGVKHAGIDGQQDSIIVTKDANNQPLQPQVWQFLRCTSQDGQAPPPGYTAPTNGPSNNYFGILRPQQATQHCLALESENDVQTGARNSILDTNCQQVDEEYRTFMYVDEIYASSNTHNLYFASQQETLQIGNTAHQELQFFANESNPGGITYQLQIQPTSTA